MARGLAGRGWLSRLWWGLLGPFSTAEAHYHSTFKEILAVKRGIEKFQFHLTGRKFTVEMDFPVLQLVSEPNDRLNSSWLP